MVSSSRVATLAGAAVVALLGCEDAADPSGVGGMVLHLVSPPSVVALDSGQVILSGPTSRTVRATPGQEVTIDGLAPGSYTVTLIGFLGQEVDYYGSTTGVQVVAGQNATPTLAFASFRPVLNAPSLAGEATQIDVSFPVVTAADSYLVEVAGTADFSGATGQIVQSPAAQIVVTGVGAYFIRARGYVQGGKVGSPSDPIVMTLIASSGERDGWASSADIQPNASEQSEHYIRPRVGHFTDLGEFGVGFAVYRMFFSFELGGLPAGEVVSAELWLYQEFTLGTPYGATALGDVVVDHYNYDLLSSSAFDADPQPGPANLGPLSTDASQGYKVLDVTGSVQADLGNPGRSQYRLRFTRDVDASPIEAWTAFSDDLETCCVGGTAGLPLLAVVTTP